jgi:hypothetical protein
VACSSEKGMLPGQIKKICKLCGDDEVKKRLSESLEPWSNWPFFERNTTKPYRGSLTAEGFRMQRISDPLP